MIEAIIINIIFFEPYHNSESGIQAISALPLRFGAWQGKDIPLESRVYEILETKSIIHRAYHADTGEGIFLSIVHYPETKVDFHAPEGCLGGQGVSMCKSTKDFELSYGKNYLKFDLNQLKWVKDQEQNLVYYFYKAGDYFGPSYISLRFNLAINKFTNSNKSASLIRISTSIISGEEEAASKLLSGFLEDLLPLLIEKL